MWGFLNPAWEARRQANELDYFNREGVKQAATWDALKTKWQRYLVLDGKTYKPESLFPDAVKVPASGWLKQAKKGVQSPSGKYAFLHIVHPRGAPLALYRPAGENSQGNVRFTTDVPIPTLIEWKYDGRDADTWMSLTPSEMMTQRNGIRRATGDVVVYGLGLGWFLAQVCLKKSVKAVTVVEKNRELLDWIRPQVLKVYPQTAKVEWVLGDAYEYAEACPADDPRAHLFDVWKGYKEAPWDDRFQKIKKRLKRVWGWGDHYVKELHGR